MPAVAASAAAAAKPSEMSPMVSLAIQALNAMTASKREEIVNYVCDTLGAYPRFWRTVEKGDEPPTNVACLVRLRVAGQELPAFAIAALDEGGVWRWNESTIAGVEAWALIPV